MARERIGPKGGLRVWRAAADDGLARVVEAGGRSYDRRSALPRLIGLDARELDASDGGLDRRIRMRLTRALRSERRRGRAGHWTYDLNRHVALLQALAGEDARSAVTGPPRRTAAPGSRRKTPPAP